MTADYGLGGPADTSSPYFFLSYARSDPLAGNPREGNPDKLVERFFADLTEAVRRHASRRADLVTGFYDQEIPAESNWKQFLSRVLGAAQVFVPLYSPGYLKMSWPVLELACFWRRAELAGVNPLRRCVPVLWTPLTPQPGAQEPPGLRDALKLGGSEPDYAKEGLRALLKIRSYNVAYQGVVDVLAKQIVTLAEGAPIEPSEVPDIDEVKSKSLPPRLAVFGIQTIALAAESTARDPEARGAYGTDSTQWRPFPEQELPLAEYASQVAERFDFEAHVSGIENERETSASRPGLLLIDPWFIADDAGRARLAAAVDQLPSWVLPLVVLSRPDDDRTRELAGEVHDMLIDGGAARTDSGRRAALGVGSLREFIAIIPVLVAEAERQYLRNHGGRVRSPGPAAMRPVLRWLAQSGESAATSDSSGEAPDA